MLPVRTLLRHLTWELPSGQTIARRFGVSALAPADLDELHHYGLGLERSTPLWYYILKEAELVEDGLRLGPVGGRLVGEVVVGLLESDSASYLAYDRDWRPASRPRKGRLQHGRLPHVRGCRPEEPRSVIAPLSATGG